MAATSAAALLLAGAPARATTVVATIIGAYDPNCTGPDYCSLVNGTTIQNYATNGGGQGDNISLFILNPNATAMTGVSLTLTGYQDAAGGGSPAAYTPTASTPATEVLNLPDIAANTVYQLIWGTTGAGVSVQSSSGSVNLFQSDYDDQLGGYLTDHAGDSLGHHCLSGSGTSTGLCSFVGNFDVSFAATLNAGPIAANFSPDNTQGGGNVAGSFVPWEGLDADGLSETYADAHTNSFPGTLAVITTGTSGSQTTPEPGTLAILGTALGGLGLLHRRRKRS